MGDWATFDWRQLDTHTLVCILSGVWQELSSRLLARYPFSLILLELIRCHLLVVHLQSLVIHVRAVRTFLSGFRFSATSSVGGVTHSAPGGRDIDTIPVFIAVTDDEETMG